MSTKVVLIRHEAPRSGEEKPFPNTLNLESRSRAFNTGKQLRNLGIIITAAHSSPQFRAIETIQDVLAGNSAGKGPICLSGVDPAFGDMLLGRYPYSNDEKAVIMAQAAAAKMSPEQFLMSSADFAEKQRERGMEGATAMYELVYKKEDAVIAICSHGGSRIESMIKACLTERNEDVTVAMMEPGEVAVLTLAGWDGLYVESYEYLGHLGDALASTLHPWSDR